MISDERSVIRVRKPNGGEMAYKHIVYEKKEDHLAYITLNRPDRLNAIDPPMQLELWDALLDFKRDPDAWVVILTGEGDPKAQAAWEGQLR